MCAKDVNLLVELLYTQKKKTVFNTVISRSIQLSSNQTGYLGTDTHSILVIVRLLPVMLVISAHCSNIVCDLLFELPDLLSH